jgi:hypothetical protein
MEIRKLDCDYVQLFPRTIEYGLAPEHVEQSDFVAECRYVETLGDVWVILQQKPPHITAQVQLTKDEADFDRKLGMAMGCYICHDYIQGDTSFFCMLSGCNVEELPMRYPDNIKAKVYALASATRWWHEYGRECLAIQKI